MDSRYQLRKLFDKQIFYLEESENALYIYVHKRDIETFKRLKTEHGFKCIRAEQVEDVIICAVLP